MSASASRWRFMLPCLLLGYAALVMVGALSGREWPYRLAVPVLAGVLAFALPLRRLWQQVSWLLLAMLMLWLDWGGQQRVVLNAVPILFNAGLAWFFARTLLSGREPLVVRMVRLIEGPERLALPGLARYTRAVTIYWAVLLGLQCLLLCACWWAVLEHAQVQALAKAYLHIGGYSLPLLAMSAEYAYRRWRFRHLPHPGLHQFVRKLALNWPRIVRGEHDTVSRS